MELATYLADHHGVITRGRARRLGLSDHQIDHRLRQGQWVGVSRGVYRLATAPATWSAQARSAALAARGLVSHRSALRIWEVDGYARWRELRVTTAAPRSHASGRRLDIPGCTIHRTRSDQTDGRLINGVPVTGLDRAVVDTAGLADDDELACVVDAVIRQRLTTIEQLRTTLRDMGTRGRTGAGRLQALLKERDPDQRVPDSVFNRMVGRLLVAAGVPEPCYEFEVTLGDRLVGRADLAYPSEALAIECDSRRWHQNRRSFAADPRRRNRLLAAGYRVLSFTWDDYAGHPDNLVATVRAALDADIDLDLRGGIVGLGDDR